MDSAKPPSISRTWVACAANAARLAVANGHDEAVADEQQDLADLHGLAVVVVTGGLQHHEQRAVVVLDLGPLVRLDRVLDCELVEMELARHGVELLWARLLEADPHELSLGAVAVVAACLIGLAQLEAAPASLAVLVYRAVDDH